MKVKNVQGYWKYVINTEEYKQGISVHRCLHEGPCSYAGRPGNFPEATSCKQLTTKTDLLSINFDGSIDFDTFNLPSVCACHIDKSWFSAWHR